MTLAIFDLDNTLIGGDSDHLWGQFVCEQGLVNGEDFSRRNEAFYAVSCLDRPAVGGVDHAAELAEKWAAEAPVFGPYMAWGNLPCWQWPMGAGTAAAAGDRGRRAGLNVAGSRQAGDPPAEPPNLRRR